MGTAPSGLFPTVARFSALPGSDWSMSSATAGGVTCTGVGRDLRGLFPTTALPSALPDFDWPMPAPTAAVVSRTWALLLVEVTLQQWFLPMLGSPLQQRHRTPIGRCPSFSRPSCSSWRASRTPALLRYQLKFSLPLANLLLGNSLVLLSCFLQRHPWLLAPSL